MISMGERLSRKFLPFSFLIPIRVDETTTNCLIGGGCGGFVFTSGGGGSNEGDTTPGDLRGVGSGFVFADGDGGSNGGRTTTNSLIRSVRGGFGFDGGGGEMGKERRSQITSLEVFAMGSSLQVGVGWGSWVVVDQKNDRYYRWVGKHEFQ